MKELRPGYKNAAHSGSRSVTGRIATEHFNTLMKTWGWSPAVTSLPSAVTSQNTLQDKEKSDSGSEMSELEQQQKKCNHNKIEEQEKTEK